ncbi:MAG: hypothetical protein G01um10147_738 [Microgenomates group bacterium Gr01-1014_7]|nr:MAG: hypothetical protein G01um10147_738 [Microgenomates group bacterium Gr01-1014_7]
MQQELLIAIFTGLGAMLGWGFADFFAKKTIDRVGSIVSLVWAHLFGTLAFSLIALYQSVVIGQQLSIPTDMAGWGLLIFFGVLQALIYLLVYIGFGKGQLAVLNPVFASYSGLAALLSITLLGEKVSASILLAVAVIFGGILLLNLDSQALRSRRLNLIHIPGLKEIGLAVILAAIWTVSWDQFVGGKDWLTYALFMYIFMTLTAVIISKLQRVNLGVVKPHLWKFLILIGLGEVIAYSAISLGFSVTSFTSIIAVLSGAFSLPTIILAHIFLKERVSSIQRAGTFIIIAGIVILSMRN